MSREHDEYNLNMMDECQVLHGSILRNGNDDSPAEEQIFEPAVTMYEDQNQSPQEKYNQKVDVEKKPPKSGYKLLRYSNIR